MRREQLPGLSVGGTWLLPMHSTIPTWQLAYVVEVSEQVVLELLEDSKARGGDVDIRVARDLLLDLARCEYTDWKEASLFGGVISGTRHLDREGRVWPAVDGQPIGRPIEVRSTAPQGAVALDLEEWRVRRREFQAQRRQVRRDVVASRRTQTRTP